MISWHWAPHDLVALGWEREPGTRCGRRQACWTAARAVELLAYGLTGVGTYIFQFQSLTYRILMM